MTVAEQNKFRSRKAWKDFRKEILKTYNNSCQRCGTHYVGARKKMLQIHHQYPDAYDDLDKEKFLCLCSTCHETWHILLDRLVKRPWEIPSYMLDNYIEHFEILNAPICREDIYQKVKEYYEQYPKKKK